MEMSRSNSFVLGPVVIHPERIASLTSLASASVISGGENGMFLSFMFIFVLILSVFAKKRYQNLYISYILYIFAVEYKTLEL